MKYSASVRNSLVQRALQISTESGFIRLRKIRFFEDNREFYHKFIPRGSRQHYLGNLLYRDSQEINRMNNYQDLYQINQLSLNADRLTRNPISLVFQQPTTNAVELTMIL